MGLTWLWPQGKNIYIYGIITVHCIYIKTDKFRSIKLEGKDRQEVIQKTKQK